MEPQGLAAIWTIFSFLCEVGSWCHNLVEKAIFGVLFDHITLVIFSSDVLTGPRPFKFFNVQCKNNELQSVVNNS